MNTHHLKTELEKELKKLEEELRTVGHINPENPADWEAGADNLNTVPADRNETADQIENYESNTSILKQLETQLGDVKNALQKIETGTYGTCEVCGQPIPDGRLAANPSARTCIAHAI